ncbi:MAG: PEP-CTERM sorting domain-containing protein [Nostoc sp.]
MITTVPEPSAIAGIILAGSLGWLVKRKQAAFRKAKV